MIKVYMRVKSTTKLGPHQRYALWVQGCLLKCPGCLAPNSWSLEGGEEVAIKDLAMEIINTPEIEGITISGGEPFLQAEELVRLLTLVKKTRDLGVFIYSGYTLAELKAQNDENVNKLLALSDLLIAGPYIAELNDNAGLRGSSNQAIIYLSTRYEAFTPHYFTSHKRGAEIVFDDDELKLVGVPSAQMRASFHNIALKIEEEEIL